MPKTTLVILLHQLVFQGMFLMKNIILHRKTGKQIRGKNKEAINSIVFFVLFNVVAVGISILKQPFGEVQLLNGFLAMALALVSFSITSGCNRSHQH